MKLNKKQSKLDARIRGWEVLRRMSANKEAYERSHRKPGSTSGRK